MNFEEIKKWFDSNEWDIGHITKEQLKICIQNPIKGKKGESQVHGFDFTNGLHWNWDGVSNGLVLIRHSTVSLDYALYEEATEILIKHGLREYSDWFHFYTNFKEAEILSGRGVRARNTLVYNYKFGFDTKICVVGFKKMIQNPPKVKRVAGNNFKEEFWHKCINCDACREACPPGAIHNEKEPYWFDTSKCDNFIGLSDHPTIPSIKKFWHENVHPEIPKELVDKVTTFQENLEMGEGPDTFMNFDANGYTSDYGIFRKDGKLISVPHCRECQSQAPCSKWGGKYPYV